MIRSRTLVRQVFGAIETERSTITKVTRVPDDIPFLYLSQADLFRLGNASTPKLDNVREVDVELFERNGIQMVRANGKGISLFTEAGIARLKGGWLWKIPHGTPMPSGVALFNNHGTHYVICPIADMTLDGYKALLSNLALRCERVRKV
jgi:hypothetical protein